MMEHPPERWESTGELRFARASENPRSQKTLQQAWKLVGGAPEKINSIEWREVPTVDVT